MKKKRIVISQNMRNVGKLSFGNILGQLISLISVPLLVRLYGATIIGVWALLTSVATISNSIADLGMTNAIMSEEYEEKVTRLYRVVSTIVFIISLITGLVVILYYSIMPNDLQIAPITAGVFVFLLAFTTQQVQICYTWLNRLKRYDVLMKNPIINNGVMTSVAVFLALIGFEEYGYYIGMLTGTFITLIAMKRYLPKGLFCFEKNTILATVRDNIKFVKYQLPSTILLQVKSQLPTLLIKLFFGAEILGYYSVTMRLINMPITFVANALGRVFFQTASELKRKKGDVGKYTLDILKKGMKLAALPLGVLLATGDIITLLLFGNSYEISGVMLRIMVFYGFFLFLSMTVNGIAIIVDKQIYTVVSGVTQIFGILAAFVVGNFLNNIYISLIFMSIVFIIVQLVYFCMIFKSSNITIDEYIKSLIKIILIILATYGILRFIISAFGMVNTL